MAGTGAEGAAEPDFTAAFEHKDDHDVGDPDPAYQQCDGTEAEKQALRHVRI